MYLASSEGLESRQETSATVLATAERTCAV